MKSICAVGVDLLGTAPEIRDELAPTRVGLGLCHSVDELDAHAGPPLLALYLE
jgi:hypothetical protein